MTEEIVVQVRRETNRWAASFSFSTIPMNYNWSSAYFDARIDNVSSIRRSNVVLVTVQLDLTSHLRACRAGTARKKRRWAAAVTLSADVTEYNGPLEAVIALLTAVETRDTLECSLFGTIPGNPGIPSRRTPSYPESRSGRRDETGPTSNDLDDSYSSPTHSFTRNKSPHKKQIHSDVKMLLKDESQDELSDSDK